MNIDIQQYEKSWNSLSWEVDDAENAFFSMLGWNEWATQLIEHIQNGSPSFHTSFSHCGSIIQKALITHFFISICKIRETSNSKLSLDKLLTQATELGLLEDQLLIEAKTLHQSTKKTFEILRTVRGQAIAHLHHHQNNPFQMLRIEGISRNDVLTYLNQCRKLYRLLGSPIGKNQDIKDLAYNTELISKFSSLHSLLQPIE